MSHIPNILICAVCIGMTLASYKIISSLIDDYYTDPPKQNKGEFEQCQNSGFTHLNCSICKFFQPQTLSQKPSEVVSRPVPVRSASTNNILD